MSHCPKCYSNVIEPISSDNMYEKGFYIEDEEINWKCQDCGTKLIITVVPSIEYDVEELEEDSE